MTFDEKKEALPKYQPWLVQQVSVPDVQKCRFFIDNEVIEE